MFHDTTTLRNSLLKALIYDVLPTIVVDCISDTDSNLNVLSDILAAAFTAYAIRGIAREHEYHPWMVGFGAGMFKYLAKDGNPIAGGFNNWAYEVLDDISFGLGGTEAAFIEGFEGAGLKFYNIIKGNSETPKNKPCFEPIVTDFVINGSIGLMVVAFDKVFYEPITKYINNYSLPTIPLLLASMVLIKHSMYNTYNYTMPNLNNDDNISEDVTGEFLPSLKDMWQLNMLPNQVTAALTCHNYE